LKLNLSEFREWKNRNISLLGMSGVGKTRLATTLRRQNWFHYSVDYRIGTRYLFEPILDQIKLQAMQGPFLRELLRKDWISIHNNIKVDDLGPVLSFVGKLGNPELLGVPLQEFRHHQELYRKAEINALRDIPSFIQKAQHIYGYQHLVNDVAGSACDLEEPAVIELLAEHTLILYIQANGENEKEKLIESAQRNPTPLYFRPEFLEKHLAIYLEKQHLQYAAEMDPDDFTRWIFPHLYRSRVPRYEAIVEPLGYTISSRDANQVRDENDFLELVERTIAEQS